MNYDNPFIKMLEAIANMLIVSFLWFLFSLPLVTIVAASSALYHTTNKIIFGPGRGNGVFRDFFESYKRNLIPGIKLSLICIVAGLFVAEGLWTGYQIWKWNIWGMLYMMLGILVSSVVIAAAVNIPPVLSRFDAPVLSIIRMAVYFGMKRPVRSVINVILFVLMLLAIESFPLAVVIVPALYTDLIRPSLERDLKIFIEENGLEEIEQEIEEEKENEEEAVSMSDIDAALSEKKKKQ